MRLGLLIILLASLKAFSQSFNNERVYLHINSSELISGESLLYSAYVLDEETDSLSSLSRILYVELLNDQEKPIKQAKILLTNGRGQGEFFVSSEINTGQYHLVAYTRWMKNFDAYYHQPIRIINPFKSYKSPEMSTNLFTAIKFYPEGGTMKVDTKTRVGVRCEFTNQSRRISGVILDEEGNRINSFETDQHGLGYFDLEVKNNPYRAMVEAADGTFQFFDLPDPCTDCSSMSITESKEQFSISLGEVGFHKVRILSNEHLLMEMIHDYDQAYQISKKDLPQTILKVELVNQSNQLLHTRLIANFDKSPNQNGTIQTYGKRERISIPIELDMPATVSVSIRPVMDQSPQDIVVSKLANSIDLPINWTHNKRSLEAVLLTSKIRSRQDYRDKYAPEHRLDHVMGTTSNVSTDYQITAAIPSKGMLQTTYANNGEFELTIPPVLDNPKIYLTGLDLEGNVNLTEEFYESYREWEEDPVTLDSLKISHVHHKSIRNQLDNIYKPFNPDSVVHLPPPFIKQFEDVKHYHLDDYNRFPTMRDTFIEYIPEVSIGKNAKDYDIKVHLRSGIETTGKHLILIDGVPFSGVDLIDINPYMVSDIDVIDHRFYFHDRMIDGMIVVSTYEGDFGKLSPNMPFDRLTGVQPPKEYNFVSHLENKTLADQRELLYWEPIKEVDGDFELGFYTSDVAGDYVIHIQGVKNNGTPVNIRRYFKVN